MRDPVELEVFKNLYHSIAEEMGAALRRTSFSPNIKERRDYSCAVFDSEGQVIAMGDHMPVHLGSMPMSVAAAVEDCELEPGDVVMLNDPFRGGTHLPDITLVMPVYVSGMRSGGGGGARPPCRCRRNLPGLHGPLPRDLPGRLPHPARQNHARRKTRCRCAGPPPQQCPHALITRRRPRRSNCRLPDRSSARPRNLPPLWNRPRQNGRRRSTRLFRRNDASLPVHHPARQLP